MPLKTCFLKQLAKRVFKSKFKPNVEGCLVSSPLLGFLNCPSRTEMPMLAPLNVLNKPNALTIWLSAWRRSQNSIKNLTMKKGTFSQLHSRMWLDLAVTLIASCQAVSHVLRMLTDTPLLRNTWRFSKRSWIPSALMSWYDCYTFHWHFVDSH